MILLFTVESLLNRYSNRMLLKYSNVIFSHRADFLFPYPVQSFWVRIRFIGNITYCLSARNAYSNLVFNTIFFYYILYSIYYILLYIYRNIYPLYPIIFFIILFSLVTQKA